MRSRSNGAANRRGSSQTLPLVLAAAASLAGCAAPDTEDLEAVEATDQALNGTLTLENCSAAQADRVRAAWDLAKTAMTSSTRRERVRKMLEEELSTGPSEGTANAYLTATKPSTPYPQTGYPEYVVAKMSNDVPTVIRCGGDANSPLEAPTHTGTERIQLTDFLVSANTSTSASIAGMILHELSHTKGFAHFGLDGNQSVPVLLQSRTDWIFGTKTTYGGGRSSFPHETILAPVGQDAGYARPGDSFNEVPCIGTQFADGLQIDQLAANQPPSAIAMTCHDRGSQRFSLTHAGGNFTDTIITRSRCAAGEVLVGLHGRSTSKLGSVGLICASESTVAAQGTTERVVSALGDNSGYITWRRKCPAGMAVKSIRGRYDQLVNRIEISCQSFTQPEVLTLSYSDDVAGAGGSRDWGNWWVEERAPGRMAMKRIDAMMNADGTIARMGGHADIVQRTSSGNQLQGGIIPIPAHGHDLYGVVKNEAACPAGQLLVGIDTYGGSYLNGVQGLCAPLANAAQISTAPLLGGTAGTKKRLTCGAGKFVVGWMINADTGIRGLQLVCRQF